MVCILGWIISVICGLSRDREDYEGILFGRAEDVLLEPVAVDVESSHALCVVGGGCLLGEVPESPLEMRAHQVRSER